MDNRRMPVMTYSPEPLVIQHSYLKPYLNFGVNSPNNRLLSSEAILMLAEYASPM